MKRYFKRIVYAVVAVMVTVACSSVAFTGRKRVFALLRLTDFLSFRPILSGVYDKSQALDQQTDDDCRTGSWPQNDQCS